MLPQEIALLAQRYLLGQISLEDKQRLLTWYNSYNEEELTVMLHSEIDEDEDKIKRELLEKILRNIKKEL